MQDPQAAGAALKGQLPPPSRRGAVLIDPSYEGHDDYRKVVATLRDDVVRTAFWKATLAFAAGAALLGTLTFALSRLLASK